MIGNQDTMQTLAARQSADRTVGNTTTQSSNACGGLALCDLNASCELGPGVPDLFSADAEGASDRQSAFSTALCVVARDQFEAPGASESYFFQIHRASASAMGSGAVHDCLDQQDMLVTMHACHELDVVGNSAVIDIEPSRPSPDATTPNVLWSLPTGLPIEELKTAISIWDVQSTTLKWTSHAAQTLAQHEVLPERANRVAQMMCDVSAFVQKRAYSWNEIGEVAACCIVRHDGSDVAHETAHALNAMFHHGWAVMQQCTSEMSSWQLTSEGMAQLTQVYNLAWRRYLLAPEESVDVMEADKWSLLALLSNAVFTLRLLPAKKKVASLTDYRKGSDKEFYIRQGSTSVSFS